MRRIGRRLLLRADEQLIRPVAPLSLPPAKDWAVDGLEARPETRMETISLFGWMLPPPEWRKAGAPPAQCDVVLRSAERWYRVAAQAKERRDVLDFYQVDNPQVLAGFQARFSPVGMRGGAYQLGLVSRAGTNDLALTWTPHVFVQDRHGFRRREGN